MSTSFQTYCAGISTCWAAQEVSTLSLWIVMSFMCVWVSLGIGDNLTWNWSQAGEADRKARSSSPSLFFLANKPGALGVPSPWDSRGIWKIYLVFLWLWEDSCFRSFVLKITNNKTTEKQAKDQCSVSVDTTALCVSSDGRFWMSLLSFTFFFRFIYFKCVLCACVNIHHMHGWCPESSEEDVGFPGTGLTDGSEPPCGC